jgi:outer membrane murein-binding lipoprotein Lpp
MSTSPNLPDAHEANRYENAGPPRWITILFVILFLATGAVIFLGYSAHSKMEKALANSQEKERVLSAQLEQANARVADLKSHVEITEQKVGMSQTELALAKSRAETIRKEQKASDERLTSQLGQVKQESEAKIGAVATEVGGAKKDIEATRNDLEATKSKLDRALGDMGVMSGLIARNRDDLEELRRRGDRNYFEFTVHKSKAPQRVGPVQISLQKTDQKKGRYTITVFADDRSIEKKDRTVGEPIQFYVKGAARTQPYEIVVFNVVKDQATGYLATPKEAAAAPSTPKPAS